MQIGCPHCNASVDVTADIPLSEVECPSCGMRLSVSIDDTLDYPDPAFFSAQLDSTPSRTSRFVFLQRLGVGGLGVVWKALDKKTGQVAAVKFPRTIGREGTRKLEHEVRMVARLQHPNIVRLLDAGLDHGRFFIATEYIDGLTLQQWCKKRRPKARAAARLCAKIAIALQHAHNAGIIHADLKPGNILVDTNDEPHLVDFGIARFVGASREEGATVVARSMLQGTPAYMAPEQASGATLHVSQSTDIYALGTILYEILTAQRPFRGEAGNILREIAFEPPQRPRSINRKIPRDLESICLKCLEKSPSARYHSASDLATDLQTFLFAVPITVGPLNRLRRSWRWLRPQLTPLTFALLSLSAVCMLPFELVWVKATVAALATGLTLVLCNTIPAISYLARTDAAKVPGAYPNRRHVARIHSLLTANDSVRNELDRIKKMLVAMRTEYRMYQSLVESLPLCVYRKDRHGRFIYANDAFCKLVKIPRDELSNKLDIEVFTPQLAAKQRVDDSEVMSAGKVLNTLEEHDKNGEIALFELLKSPVRNVNREIVGVETLMWDVSAHKRAEAALREAKAAAEAANQAKSHFLANMSHEIRTPINAIVGMTELLLRKQIDRESQHYLKNIQGSSESLLSIINEVLDFSKIEAGKLTLEQVHFDIREHVGDTMRSLGPRAFGKGLELTWRIDHDTPQCLIGDPTRLRQIITNLTNNAVKFTKAGEVVLTGTCSHCDESTLDLTFTVRDTGIGIPLTKQRLIFEAFEQVDTSPSRGFGGTGLGLTISKSLVELMGGRMWLTSEPGKGSTFAFAVRVARTDDGSGSCNDATLAKLAGRRVLVVDDNSSSREILEDLLTSWNLHSTAIETSIDARRLLDSQKNLHSPFHAALVDAILQTESGFALACDLKKRYQMPVVMMLCPTEDSSDVAYCDQCGIAAWIMKPIKHAELADALGIALGVAIDDKHDISSPQSWPSSRLGTMNVLVVEDHPLNQEFAVRAISEAGHVVTVANNGQEALKKVETESFDVILMDVQMPVMDGLEATMTIRLKEAISGQHVPIVAMTAHAVKGDRERFLRAGMDGYISKPIKVREFIEQLDVILSKHEVRRKTSFEKDGDVFDKRALSQRIRGDVAFLLKIITMLKEHYPRLLQEIESAIAERDSASIVEKAHTLKGVVGNFHAADAERAAEKIQESGRRGEFDRANVACQELRHEMASLVQALEEYARECES